MRPRSLNPKRVASPYAEVYCHAFASEGSGRVAFSSRLAAGYRTIA